MTGKELRNLRKARGLTQAELAEILGVTTLTIWRAEKRKPSRMLLAYLHLAMSKGLLTPSNGKINPCGLRIAQERLAAQRTDCPNELGM
jgi:transcriptional regulator with XRE-family HTH domain